MPKFKPGQKARIRLNLWNDHQTVNVLIYKRFLFLYLVEWDIYESWDGKPPFTHYKTSRWVPVWWFL